MKDLYDNYYEEGFSQNKSQTLDLKNFELIARKYRWNYQRFFSSLPKNARILDIGCGLGQFLFYLRKEGFQQLTGVDISQSQVDLALQMQPKVDFRKIEDTCRFLEQRQGKYDVIILNDVVEHLELEDNILLLKAIHSSLKQNGKIIIKTVNAAFPLGSSTRYADLTHKTSFHKKSLTHLLRHTNFRDIRCYSEEIGVYNLLFMAKKILVRINRMIIRVMIYLAESDWQDIISVNIISIGVKK
ncbi:MAG: class I SAM-dependent methyltransferase [Candidatus Electrothrix sp. AR5]|nr:class I SAM-dependent methyltransferase [Candidatus Electrothrix sp. AR5]